VTPTPVLEARRISKRFGGVHALKNVSFDVLPGEVHALCGENGAGKSTLMKVLTGQHPAGTFEGAVFVRGEAVQFRDVRDSERGGIGIVHQELSLVDSMTAAENILLGNYPRRGWRVDWPATMAKANAVLRQFSVPIDAETLVAELGVGQQQLVEIARALSKAPRILLLDEPTAALSTAETSVLLDQVRQLCAAGMACVYISHKLDEVMQIADRITVLRDGASVATFSRDRVDVATIIRHMVGREIQDVYPPRAPSAPGEVALEVTGLSARSEIDHHVALHEVSFEVRAGEVLGIGGLMGAGRSELLMHIYGLWGTTTYGQVKVMGKLYRQRSPSSSLKRGMMLVTESRKRFGIIPNQSTHHNLSLSSLGVVSRWGRIQPALEGDRNSAMLQKMQFRALHANGRIDELSGGNQQKVVIGRGLLTEPNVVLLDEPTRGVDVGAKREIYEEINRLAREGKAVVMVSSELPELIGMCDRIVMMQRGRMTDAFERESFDANRLLTAALTRE